MKKTIAILLSILARCAVVGTLLLQHLQGVEQRAPIFFLGNICKSSRSCQPLAVKSHLLESSLLAVGGSKITVVPFAASSKRRIQY